MYLAILTTLAVTASPEGVVAGTLGILLPLDARPAQGGQRAPGQE